LDKSNCVWLCSIALVSSINYATDRDGYSLGLNSATYFELADGKAVNSLTFTSNIN